MLAPSRCRFATLPGATRRRGGFRPRRLAIMVRREEVGLVVRLGGGRASCCSSLAGVSPVPVGVGAPGSRPQVFGGDPFARAGCRKPARRCMPLSGEQARGPQRHVKPAASSQSQSGSRAAHVTVKAMSVALVPKRVAGSGGVWGAARVQRGGWNTGDPSRLPLSRQGASYKPRAKSGAAERESEGIVVPLRVVWHNAVLGKGPCGG